MLIATIVLCIVGYSSGIGLSLGLIERLYPNPDENGYHSDGRGAFRFFGSVLWPAGLPVALSYLLILNTFKHVDAKREAAAKEAEELKRRIAELDAELHGQASKL